MKPEHAEQFRKQIEENKPKWGPGPWQDEPDRVEFEHEGIACLMSRQSQIGHWCGYVGVEPGHPWHGEAKYFWDRQDGPEVHGGVTFGAECGGFVCHVPKPGKPENLWWIGFDCAHLGDLSPSIHRNVGHFLFDIGGGEHYRTADYVRREVERLAEQAKAAQSK